MNDALFYITLLILLVITGWVNFITGHRANRRPSPPPTPKLPPARTPEEIEELCQLAQSFNSQSGGLL